MSFHSQRFVQRMLDNISTTKYAQSKEEKCKKKPREKQGKVGRSKEEEQEGKRRKGRKRLLKGRVWCLTTKQDKMVQQLYSRCIQGE